MAEPKWTHPNRIAERRAHHAAWRRKNAEHVLRKAREWAAKNPDLKHANQRKWARLNREQILHRAHARRAQYRESPVTPADWAAILATFNHTCPSCGGMGRKLEIDHIVPLSKGGAHEVGNLQPLCRSCNSSKSDKTIRFAPWPGGEVAA